MLDAWQVAPPQPQGQAEVLLPVVLEAQPQAQPKQQGQAQAQLHVPQNQLQAQAVAQHQAQAAEVAQHAQAQAPVPVVGQYAPSFAITAKYIDTTETNEGVTYRVSTTTFAHTLMFFSHRKKGSSLTSLTT